ncbi:hypothetical protein ACFL5Z_10175 [Planctomycetota bacterium]
MSVASLIPKRPTEQVQLLAINQERVYMTTATGCVRWNIIALDKCLLEVVWIVSTRFLICLDQPNRRIRTRMSGGVGGGLREEAPYPDRRSYQ